MLRLQETENKKNTELTRGELDEIRAQICALADVVKEERRSRKVLEREVKWLKQHMPEPDLRYMG